MSSPILQLTTDDLVSALAEVDSVELLADEVVGQAAGGVGRPVHPGYRLTPWRGRSPAGTAAEAELVLLEDLRTGTRCVLPAPALFGLRTATSAALAARELVAPGVVTAAVLGSGLAAQASLTLIARQLPGLSHVAMCQAGDESDKPMEPRVVDELDLAGVGWLVTDDVAEAVFGATLIVTTVAGAHWPEIGQLPRGAVLINTTGEDLPDDLVDAVDQVYVDDLSLIERNSHRYFARTHMAGFNSESPFSGRPDGRRFRGIEADFAALLTGQHAGRTDVDHVLLVELLDANALDARLAGMLHRAALEYGLGVPLIE